MGTSPITGAGPLAGGFGQQMPALPLNESAEGTPASPAAGIRAAPAPVAAGHEERHVPHIFSFRVRINEEIGRITVEMLDPATGEVVRQIPPEELERFLAAMQRHIGQLLDRHV